MKQWILACLILALLLALVGYLIGPMAYLVFQFFFPGPDRACENNQNELRRHFHLQELFEYVDGKFTDTYPKEMTWPDNPEMSICPGCSERYIYSGVTPAGDRIRWPGERGRFVLWCPQPCHDGKRYFLGADGQVNIRVSDDQVDWSNQIILSD